MRREKREGEVDKRKRDEARSIRGERKFSCDIILVLQVGEYERMSKDLSRVAYTRRIMEIVHNIQRQKEDINKILGDTRMVQKEINQLTGKLERVFTTTDEQIFKDARKDEARRVAYKLLAKLREVRFRVLHVDDHFPFEGISDVDDRYPSRYCKCAYTLGVTNTLTMVYLYLMCIHVFEYT